MADIMRGPKKQKMQLAMEEAELRSLRIPSSAHRGALSPSKNSFLPTLQEQAQERGQQHQQKSEGRRRLFGRRDEDADERERSQRQAAGPERQVLSDISAELLESVKQDFEACNGALNLEQFLRTMLRSLEPSQAAGEDRKQARRNTSKVMFRDDEAKAGSMAATLAMTQQRPRQAAAVIDLFRQVDVHGEGTITWDGVSNHLIEQGMAGGDEFTVDSIKTYEASSVVDQTKHESTVEKLVYLEQVDAVVCLSHNSRHFRLYDPKRCTVRHEVAGHRGTVVNCCYVDSFGQIATTSADMTICLWDSTHLGLRNRMSTKDVQLCLQWDAHSRSLFSGSIDGTLSRWDLTNMCLADTRRQHKKAINDLLMVEDINLLASASSDGAILMWDTQTMQRRKTFKGHKKGTFSLAYSMDYHCLLTAGLDQDALVWNPYVEKVPIFRLKGHTHALCGVTVVPGTPQILSADVTGTFRLFDMRNFREVQSFGGSETHVNDLNTFCAIPAHRRIVAGGSRLTLYDYMDEWGGDSVTDTGGVTDALYNPNAGEFYTVSKQTVKTWNASTGGLFKVLRDVARSEITAACLADNGRKLYLGDSEGRVAAHGLNNGALLTEFERHNMDVSCITIWKGTNRLFASSWDGAVKVYTDECSRPPQTKAEFQHHHDGVTCLACSPELKLLASGGTDMQVIVYDLKTMKLEHAFPRFQHVIAGIDFFASRCLLAVADQGGLISLWRVRPHPDHWTCVYHFWNLPRFGGQALPIPVSALRFSVAVPSATPAAPPMLYTADSKGGLRCWDITVLCERKSIVETDLKELFERQRIAQLAAAAPGLYRNASVHDPHQIPSRRISPSPLPAPSLAGGDTGRHAAEAAAGGFFLTGMDAGGDGRGAEGGSAEGSLGASPDRREVQILYEAAGHDDSVVSMHMAGSPDALITCGLDRRVRIWSGPLERLGVLLQSRDRQFRFPCNAAAAQAARLEEATKLLQQLGPLEPRTTQVSRLPALSPNGNRNANDTLLDFGIGGRRRPPRRKDPDAQWKAAAEQVIEDPDADEENYQILFEQMERINHGASLDQPTETAQDRLTRHAQHKFAGQMPHRTTALSKDEAAAAERLAKAMSALGGDDFGTYSAMARSLRPRGRSDKAKSDFTDDTP